MAPDERAMAMKRKAKKEKATGATLRIRSTMPPPPVLMPRILTDIMRKRKKKTDKKECRKWLSLKGPAPDFSKQRKEREKNLDENKNDEGREEETPKRSVVA